ncbi:ElyC/SanA/YdcF family protein [Azorhizobium doebereinerae]|uniref:ElyC/SanA/YdcF family protein n=1 Tax=Azorhizobium doebereinerae TaxID=281091 RepID=UPI0004055BF4|nr:ElyC/SanA/YdcF family protein [Azorhizobium doebereinerae]
MPDVTVPHARELTQHLFRHLPPGRTAIGLALGCGAASGAVALAAARLFHARQFDRIVVAGGVAVMETEGAAALLPLLRRAGLPQPRPGEIEADYMARLMRAAGVPPARLVLERASAHTGENFAFTRALVGACRSITLLNCAPTALRVVATARKYWCPSETVLTFHPVYPFGIDRHNWPAHPVIRRFVLDEHAKMADGPGSYVARGFCVPVDWAAEAARAATLPPVPRRPPVPGPRLAPAAPRRPAAPHPAAPHPGGPHTPAAHSPAVHLPAARMAPPTARRASWADAAARPSIRAEAAPSPLRRQGPDAPRRSGRGADTEGG